ncbi:MAG: O-antigen polymerase [Campylobacterota bacterium]|nr:O-antigen polymerase [Campylobacterota bacterium]
MEVFLNAVLLLCYITVFCLLSLYIYKNIQEGWSLETFFLSLFILFYVVIPISFIINHNFIFQEYSSPDLDLYSTYFSAYSFTSFSIVLIALFGFFTGSYFATTQHHILIKVKERYLDFSLFKLSVVKSIGIFLSLLSFISMFIYASQFGGFEQAIYYANWVNAGYVDDAALSSQYIFVNRFIYLSLISFTIFFFIKQKSNLFYIIFLLIIPLITTLVSRVFLFSGKESIIDIALLIIFYLSIRAKSSYLLPLTLFAVLLYFALPVMDTLIDSRQDLSFANIQFFSVLKFLEYFTFPQISLEFALNREYTFLLFDDFIYGLRGNIVPFSWLQEFSISTMELNTYYFNGEYKSIVPPGLLAFSYYSFGIIGTIGVGLTFGFIIKKLDTLFISMRKKDIAFSIFYAFIMIDMFSAVRSGVPKLTLYSTSFIVFVLMMVLSFEFYFKKSSQDA